MIPDPYKKTLRLPVRLNDGRFELFHGGVLPKIKVGAIADLVIESHYFENPADVSSLEIHKTVTVQEKGAVLMARISSDYCESIRGLIRDLKVAPPLGFPVAFVPIQLTESLDLTLVFGKPAHLNDCPCSLPTMDNLLARSVNHAFTLASRHYETRRRSNGGNVFLNVYFDDGMFWRPLRELRSRKELVFETEIAQRNGELGL